MLLKDPILLLQNLHSVLEPITFDIAENPLEVSACIIKVYLLGIKQLIAKVHKCLKFTRQYLGIGIMRLVGEGFVVVSFF